MEDSPLGNPKKYLQGEWATLSPKERRSLYDRIKREMDTPWDKLYDPTLYTPPLSVVVTWLKEMVDKDEQ